MKKAILNLFNDKLVKICLMASFFLILLTTTITLVSKPFLPPYIPLFNSLPWGVDRLARPDFIYLIPLSLGVFFVLNTFICMTFYGKNALMSRILSFNSLVLSLLGLVAYIEIMITIF